jgi:hypothetical protein
MKAVYHYQDVCGVCGDEKRLRVPVDGNGTEETWVRCFDCGRITRVTKGPMDEEDENETDDSAPSAEGESIPRSVRQTERR